MSFNKKKGTFEVLLQLERDLAGASGKNKLTEAITVQSAFHPSNLKATGGVATVRELQLQISSPRFSKVDELTDSSVHELLAQYSAEKKKVRVALGELFAANGTAGVTDCRCFLRYNSLAQSLLLDLLGEGGCACREREGRFGER